MNKKNVLITGGMGGIGSSIVTLFKNSGHNVIVTSTGKKISSSDKNITVDFDDYIAFNSFLNDISKIEIDILINCAGINYIESIVDYPIEKFDKIINVNLRAPFRIIQTVLPTMIKNKYGRIINITSIFSCVSKEYRAAYSASKFGLDGLTAAIAAEIAKYNILINSVSPGFIDTKLTRSILSEPEISKITNNIPIGRLGSPMEIAEFILWLSSEKNTYISGQNLIIDGGFVRV